MINRVLISFSASQIYMYNILYIHLEQIETWLINNTIIISVKLANEGLHRYHLLK